MRGTASCAVFLYKALAYLMPAETIEVQTLFLHELLPFQSRLPFVFATKDVVLLAKWTATSILLFSLRAK